MQAQLFCATCAKPLSFDVPELTRNRWHVDCPVCGNATALAAIPGKPEERATFDAIGIYSSP